MTYKEVFEQAARHASEEESAFDLLVDAQDPEQMLGCWECRRLVAVQFDGHRTTAGVCSGCGALLVWNGNSDTTEHCWGRDASPAAPAAAPAMTAAPGRGPRRRRRAARRPGAGPVPRRSAH